MKELKIIKKQILLSIIFTVIFQCFSFGQGSSYSGPYTASAPIVKNGVSNITISGLQISNASGPCITLINCSNITIQNCKLGPSTSNAVDLNNCTNITVTNCSMANIASGLHAYMGSGIKFIYNDIQNVVGPYPRGQMAQFDHVSGTGNRINFNSCDNISGQSNPEDLINIYMSNGTANDPIQACGNWLRGGGPSLTGGGMLVGDNGGTYQLVENNVCVNTGHEGIQIAGGHDITVRNNKVYSQQTTVSAIGVVVAKEPTAPCTVENNQINWINSQGVQKNLYNAGAASVITGWSTNSNNTSLNSSILPVKIIGRGALQDTIPTKPDTIVTKPDTIPTTKPVVVNLKIYPNPVYSSSFIVTAPTPNIDKIVIYNSEGLKMIETSINKSKTIIDTSILAMGVYHVKILENEKILEERKITIVKN